MHFFFPLQIKHFQKVNENRVSREVNGIFYQVSFPFKVMRPYMLDQVLELLRCFANTN